MATINLGRIGFVDKGAWADGLHKVLDTVTYNENVYACILEHTSVAGDILPTNGTYWELWVQNDDKYTKTETEALSRGFKNAIINGDFGENQYDDIDTAPVAMTNGVILIDRFTNNIGTVTGTLERILDQTVNSKVVNTLKAVSTSTGTVNGIIGAYQKSENLFLGETKTFSAWVKSNNANARLLVRTSVATYSSTPHSGGGGWEYLTVTCTIPATTTYLFCYASLIGASVGNVPITLSDYIESTMWQLESGTVATPFEQLLKGMQLANCQRYAYEICADTAGVIGVGLAYTTSIARVHVRFPTKMRVAPTITHVNPSPGLGFVIEYNGTSSSEAGDASSQVISSDGMEVVYTTGQTLTVGHAVGLRYALANTSIFASAEL